MDQICWVDNPLGVYGRCQQMYAKETGERFGHPFGSQAMNKSMVINLGKMCKKGFAVAIDNRTAQCVELANITSNLDNYKEGMS